MNQVNNESKSAAIKTLAIIGFIAVIIIGVWLAVQVVRLVPNAFSSLASIADSINNNRPVNSLTVASEKSIVNAGEAFQISWTDLNREGTYSFNYICTEGVSIDARTADGIVTALQCGDSIDLAEGTQSLDLIVSSEKRRFIDVPFTIMFTQAGADETLFERNSKVTVVNATIPQSVVVAVDTDVDETVEVTPEPETPAFTPTPTVTETIISRIPTSDPNGFTDLKVTYLGVGKLDGNTFVPTGTIDNDDRGAIRFEVKNIGSKTSGTWTFESTLPSGFVFESDEQAPLKPNERAVYTLGFNIEGSTGTKTIATEVEGGNDTNNSNNSFTWSVAVTD